MIKSVRPPAQLRNDLEYDVGYGKPPAKHRFQKGQSGNPKGRPKGQKSRSADPGKEPLKAIILAEAYRSIKVNDGPKQITLPMAAAVMRSVAVNAAKGNARSQRLFTQLVSFTESANRSDHDAWMDTVASYKCGWEEELDRRKRFGIILPDPVPHPDDILYDPRTGTVQFVGPMTREELAKLDDLLIWRDREQQLAVKLVQQNNAEHASIQADVRQEIVYNKRILEIIGRAIASRASKDCVNRRLAYLNLPKPNRRRPFEPGNEPDKLAGPTSESSDRRWSD